MTIIGHSAVSLIIWKLGIKNEAIPSRRHYYFLPILIGAMPDIDVTIHSLEHRGASHSVFVSLALSIVALTLLRTFSWPFSVKTALFVILCAVSHPLFDMLTKSNPVHLFWPYGEKDWHSSLRYFPIAYYSRSVGGFLGILKMPYTWQCVFFELIFCGLLYQFFLIKSAKSILVNAITTIMFLVYGILTYNDWS